jgi:hypothetical protein
MKLIAAAIDEVALSPLHDFPNCQIFYFKRKICDVVQVRNIIFAMKIHLIIFFQERIGIYCVQVEAASSTEFHSDIKSEQVDDSSLPPLIDLSLD